MGKRVGYTANAAAPPNIGGIAASLPGSARPLGCRAPCGHRFCKIGRAGPDGGGASNSLFVLIAELPWDKLQAQYMYAVVIYTHIVLSLVFFWGDSASGSSKLCWGRDICCVPGPLFSQVDYPGGNILCMHILCFIQPPGLPPWKVEELSIRL